MSNDIRGASRGQALACYRPPFRYQSGYVFDANNHMVADMPGSAVCRVRGWGRLKYRTDCDPEALQDMVGILIAEALTRFWEDADLPALGLERVRDAAQKYVEVYRRNGAGLVEWGEAFDALVEALDRLPLYARKHQEHDLTDAEVDAFLAGLTVDADDTARRKRIYALFEARKGVARDNG